MRWPNRSPHVLTRGMRRAQAGLAGFLPLIDWPRFRRRNLNGAIALDDPTIVAFGCGDAAQAVVWLLRTRPKLPDGRVDGSRIAAVTVGVPGLAPGRYTVTAWDTALGREHGRQDAVATGNGVVSVTVPLGADLALALRAA